MERDLELLGLLVLENRLKPESVDVLAELQEADVRTIMVTGAALSFSYFLMNSLAFRQKGIRNRSYPIRRHTFSLQATTCSRR